jgi:hypothetical protein
MNTFFNVKYLDILKNLEKVPVLAVKYWRHPGGPPISDPQVN